MTISLPVGFCVNCKCALKLLQVGVELEVVVPHISIDMEQRRVTNWISYYKISSDVHECPSCGNKIFAGFGQPVERFKPDFENIKADLVVRA